MSLENEPERLALYNRYVGASIALTGFFDTLSELQVFTIAELWPEGSKELDAVSDAMEALKHLVAYRNDQVKAAARGVYNGDSEE